MPVSMLIRTRKRKLQIRANVDTKTRQSRVKNANSKARGRNPRKHTKSKSIDANVGSRVDIGPSAAVSAMSDGQDARDAVEFFFRAIGDASYDNAIIKCTKCISASKQEVIFALTVSSDVCNSMGSMHGGNHYLNHQRNGCA